MKTEADNGMFKSAGMKRANARDQQVSKGKQFGIGNFFSWAMKKYPKLTLGQLELKMPSLEREYAQEKAMRKAEPEMKPSVNPHEGADLNRLRELSGLDTEDDDLEEGKLPAGLQAYQDKKNGKKDDADKDEDKEVDEGITGAVAGGILGSAGGPLGTAAGAYLGHKIQKGAKKKKKQDEDKDEVAESFARMRLLAGLPINEDDVTKVAVGHVDAEADMLRKELFKIGKYSVELYKMLGELPDGDFPHWWQAKIVKAGEYIGSAKHYLEGEMYAPEEESPIDRPPEEQEDINPSGI